MTGRQRRQLNHFFVETFNNILLYEEQALSDAGSGKLSVKELHVLAAVGLLEAEGQNTMTRIAAALNITVGALTTAVNTLIRKGYLARVADQSDRRLVRVVLTESGRLADAIGAILLLAVLIASVVGVSSASIVAVLGSVSLAIGLALQGSLANFAGGVMILLFKPFVIGDYIELKTGEVGTVTDISIFYTTLLTVDNRRLVIPNGAVSNASVTNYTAMPQRRVDLEFSVAYDSDAALVKRLILETAAQDPRIQKDPAPFARMTRMDASALVFTFRGWCETGDYWEVYFDLCERVKAAFDANGVAIPFPQMDVHVNAPLKTDEG